ELEDRADRIVLLLEVAVRDLERLLQPRLLLVEDEERLPVDPRPVEEALEVALLGDELPGGDAGHRGGEEQDGGGGAQHGPGVPRPRRKARPKRPDRSPPARDRTLDAPSGRSPTVRRPGRAAPQRRGPGARPAGSTSARAPARRSDTTPASRTAR